MTLLGSKNHTAGDTKRWRLDYSRWLDNTAIITEAELELSSETCMVEDTTILGKEVVFYLVGGVQGEVLTVSVTLTDSLGNVKHDTIAFHVLAP